MTFNKAQQKARPMQVVVDTHSCNVAEKKTGPTDKISHTLPKRTNSERLSMPAKEYVADFEPPKLGANSHIRPAEF